MLIEFRYARKPFECRKSIRRMERNIHSRWKEKIGSSQQKMRKKRWRVGINIKMKTIAEWLFSKCPTIRTMIIALTGSILTGCGGMPILMDTAEIHKGHNYSFSVSTSLAKEIIGRDWKDRPYVIPKWALTCHRSIYHFWETDIGINFGLRMYKELATE